MKIVIAGVKYGLEESISKATLGDLYTLKIKSGVSVKTIRDTFTSFGEMTDALDLLDDATALINLQGVIWLSRRKAGEAVTFEEAGNVSFTELSFEVEDDEGADDEDPKEPAASGQDESGEPPQI